MLISFKDLVKKYDMIITGVIHIGGHYGEELQDYIDEGIQDMIIFEPLDSNFKVTPINNIWAVLNYVFVDEVKTQKY